MQQLFRTQLTTKLFQSLKCQERPRRNKKTIYGWRPKRLHFGTLQRSQSLETRVGYGQLELAVGQLTSLLGRINLKL